MQTIHNLPGLVFSMFGAGRLQPARAGVSVDEDAHEGPTRLVRPDLTGYSPDFIHQQLERLRGGVRQQNELRHGVVGVSRGIAGKGGLWAAPTSRSPSTASTTIRKTELEGTLLELLRRRKALEGVASERLHSGDASNYAEAVLMAEPDFNLDDRDVVSDSFIADEALAGPMGLTTRTLTRHLNLPWLRDQIASALAIFNGGSDARYAGFYFEKYGRWAPRVVIVDPRRRSKDFEKLNTVAVNPADLRLTVDYPIALDSLHELLRDQFRQKTNGLTVQERLMQPAGKTLVIAMGRKPLVFIDAEFALRLPIELMVRLYNMFVRDVLIRRAWATRRDEDETPLIVPEPQEWLVDVIRASPIRSPEGRLLHALETIHAMIDPTGPLMTTAGAHTHQVYQTLQDDIQNIKAIVEKRVER